MRVLHCEECLSRRGVYRLCWGGTCRDCGHAPTCQLTPNEIRTCLGIAKR